MAELELRKVVKRFGSAEVIHGIDLQIRDGEFVVFVGPSGCGKSTLLRMIAGLEPVSEGRLWIGDRLANGLAPQDRNISMVFQSYALFPHLTVRGNMELGLRQARRRANAAIIAGAGMQLPGAASSRMRCSTCSS